MQNAAIFEGSNKPASELKFDLAILGRVLPILAWIAWFYPIIKNAIVEVLKLPIGQFGTYQGALLKSSLLNIFGQYGLELFAPLAAALIMFAVYRLARSIGASALVAGLGALISLMLSIFGISPNLANMPDDAIFAGFVLLGFAALLKSVKQFDPPALAFAFIYCVIACWFRPLAAWPILTVFIVTAALNRDYEGRPYYALISALCWGPGLFLASRVAEFVNSNFALSNLKAHVIFANQQLAPNLNSWALNLVPLIILFVLALIAIIYYLSKDTIRPLAYALSIIIIASIMGAALYGAVIGGRYLLDNLFLSIFVSLFSSLKIFDKMKSPLTIRP